MLNDTISIGQQLLNDLTSHRNELSKPITAWINSIRNEYMIPYDLDALLIDLSNHIGDQTLMKDDLQAILNQLNTLKKRG